MSGTVVRGIKRLTHTSLGPYQTQNTGQKCKVVIKPPPLKRSIGRLARNTKRAADEERKGNGSSTFKCSRYKEYGHNVKTCKGGLTAKEKKKKKKKKSTATTSSQPTKPKGRSRSITRAYSSQPIIRA